jgi:hypothetical protein
VIPNRLLQVWRQQHHEFAAEFLSLRQHSEWLVAMYADMEPDLLVEWFEFVRVLLAQEVAP